MKTKSPAKGDMLMLLLTIYVLTIKLVVQPILLPTLGIDVYSGIGRVIFFYGILAVTLFIPFVFYLLFTKQKPTDALLLKIPSTKNILLSVALGIALIPIMILCITLLSILRSLIFPSVDMDIVATAPSLGAVIIFGAVFASVFEEIWFRGIIYDQYHGHRQGASIGKTALVTSLFFGLMHGDIVQVSYAIPIGMILAYLLYYTRSIWIPITTHFVINALSLSLNFIDTPESSYAQNYVSVYGDYYYQAADGMLAMVVLFGGASLVMIPAVILCLKKFKKYHATNLLNEKTSSNTIETVETKTKGFSWIFWTVTVIWTVIILLREFGVIGL